MKTFLNILIVVSSILSQSQALEAPKELKILASKIHSLNLDLTCKSHEDCVALPVGYKACGGPERYIVASKANIKFNELIDTIDRHLKADKEWKNKENLGSTCDVLQKPTTRCQIKKCSALGRVKLFGR